MESELLAFLLQEFRLVAVAVRFTGSGVVRDSIDVVVNELEKVLGRSLGVDTVVEETVAENM
jgi:hypothetical protein